jgi:hypothetical protein
VRDASQGAALSDIGSPVDPLILQAIQNTGANASKATAIIEPVDNRYLLHIGTTTYAFSFFPNGKVSAWSIYDNGLQITDFALSGQRLYARAGNTIYLYGGDDNNSYENGDTEIRLPFLSAKSLATIKHFTAIDVICDGNWVVYMGTDPTQPDLDEEIARLDGSTIGLGDVLAQAQGELFSLRFVAQDANYGRIAALVIHYEPMEAG